MRAPVIRFAEVEATPTATPVSDIIIATAATRKDESQNGAFRDRSGAKDDGRTFASGASSGSDGGHAIPCSLSFHRRREPEGDYGRCISISNGFLQLGQATGPSRWSIVLSTYTCWQ